MKMERVYKDGGHVIASDNWYNFDLKEAIADLSKPEYNSMEQAERHFKLIERYGRKAVGPALDEIEAWLDANEGHELYDDMENRCSAMQLHWRAAK